MKTPLCSLYLAATLAVFSPCANADTFTVTNTDGGTGAGTLYRAVSDALALGGELPHIVEMTGISGKIELAQELPNITGFILINGPGASKLEITTDQNDRVVEVAAGGNLGLVGITFNRCGGTTSGGGAILNNGQLTVSDCTFTNCQANDGAAIRSLGTQLSLFESAFIGNLAGRDSGAVEVFSGSATIDSSCFYDNEAVNDGGAIGVFSSATCEVSWCSVYNNRANKAGGIYSNGTCSIENSIVAGNTDRWTGEDDNLSASVSLREENLTKGDPMLRSISAYGGEVPYLLPHLDSPVIGAAGTHSGLIADPRGIPRPTQNADLGAVEVQTFQVTSHAGGTSSPGDTLHAAMRLTEDTTRTPLDYIDLRSLGRPITLTSPLPDLTRRAIVVGGNPSRGGANIEGDDTFRIFNVRPGGHLRLENIGLQFGFSNLAGGAVLNEGNLVARGCRFYKCTAPNGAAIQNTQTGRLDIGACFFDECSTTVDSGAIENLGSPHCVIVNSIFFENEAGNNGGAIGSFYAQSHMRIDHCSFLGNTAGAQGDAVYVLQGTAEITRCAVLDWGYITPASSMFSDGGSITQMQNWFDSGSAGSAFEFIYANSLLVNAVDPAVAIDESEIPLDQREVDRFGNPRPHLGRRDIGAIEFYSDRYLAWVSRNFPTASLQNLRNGAARRSDDPDGDDISNFFELILGSNPHKPDRHLNPRIVAKTAAEGGGYAFEYRRAVLHSVGADFSTDLKTWAASPVDLWHKLDADGVPLYRAATNTPSSAKVFYRLAARSNAENCLSMHYSYVGDAGNSPDPATALGQVDYPYLIGTYEVTNREYATFLNCVDPLGTNSLELYDDNMPTTGISRDSSRAAGEKYVVSLGKDYFPAAYVSCYSALRFCNWMSNGTDSEYGSYLLSGDQPIPTNAASITRASDAIVVLPSKNEWYKAAYYLGSGTSYALYPTGATTAGMANNTPNHNQYSMSYGLTAPTEVGAHTQAKSNYGTFDQGGNVEEWSEIVPPQQVVDNLGGGFTAGESATKSTRFVLGPPSASPNLTRRFIGFRVVRIR